MKKAAQSTQPRTKREEAKIGACGPAKYTEKCINVK